jgi:hypothetical protein
LSIGAVVSFGEPDTFKIDQTVACKDFGAREIMAEEREVRISLAQAKKFSSACDKCHAELVINIGSNKGHENMQTYEISRLPTSRSVMSFFLMIEKSVI